MHENIQKLDKRYVVVSSLI